MSLLLFLLICMYVILPLFELINIDSNYDKPFPYKMKFPYDTNNNTFNYIITYVLTSIAGFCVVTTLFSEDSLFCFFVTHACGQMKVLHKNIKILAENLCINIEYIENLKQIIEQHNQIIR